MPYLNISDVNHNTFIADNISAIYDVCFIGDHFLREVMDTFHAIVRKAKMKNEEKPTAIPYLEQYYNIQSFYAMASDQKTTATSRNLNAAMAALNDEDRLPCFMIIILDKDLLIDLKGSRFWNCQEYHCHYKLRW